MDLEIRVCQKLGCPCNLHSAPGDMPFDTVLHYNTGFFYRMSASLSAQDRQRSGNMAAVQYFYPHHS